MTEAEISKQEIQKWRMYLADERMEAALYTKLANKKTGEEKQILLELASAEHRHAKHWMNLLGEHAYPEPKPSIKSRIMAKLTFLFGSIFILAIMQKNEERAKYMQEANATPRMFADEQVHAEVVRALTSETRNKISGNFRAAIFGMNDGIVSNLALVLGVAASGVQSSYILITGIAGCLAGSLSMAAGEYISVKSQKELIKASEPNSYTDKLIANLDMQENEVSLIFRARGYDSDQANHKASELLQSLNTEYPKKITDLSNGLDSNMNALSVALFSFLCFGVGSLIPVLHYIFAAYSFTAMLVSTILSGIALISTGTTVGVLSGVNPAWPAFRQLLIGYFAATITVILGIIFKVSL